MNKQRFGCLEPKNRKIQAKTNEVCDISRLRAMMQLLVRLLDVFTNKTKIYKSVTFFY
ncbi:unnamed protein product [Acanthoscelides obtectus]|uniref:Uncharacterized protein n=1 Tax=Acanthoscelides obtectus TaxID=200917 RepID=A0A9P0KUD1_ACAOB|nr:unnamed protein product [Acanthoscelides obtectus]CAK1663028.1 hypothetical protein AOBTE_LOCUS23439 [Acanthoscelides obtectus]